MTPGDATFSRLRNFARSGGGQPGGEQPGAGPGQEGEAAAEEAAEEAGGRALHDVDRLLDLVFEWFGSRFSPERAQGAAGIFHYEVNTPLGVRHRYVTVADGVSAASTWVARQPDATIGVDLHDLVALAVGDLKGTEAFISGRLKISGDVFFAMNWIEWFGARSGTARPRGTQDDG